MDTPSVFDADLLCLDLVNTRLVRSGEPVDLLPDFAHLAEWLLRAGLAEPSEEAGLAERGRPEADEALALALTLREAIRELADASRAHRQDIPSVERGFLDPLRGEVLTESSRAQLPFQERLPIGVVLPRVLLSLNPRTPGIHTSWSAAWTGGEPSGKRSACHPQPLRAWRSARRRGRFDRWCCGTEPVLQPRARLSDSRSPWR